MCDVRACDAPLDLAALPRYKSSVKHAKPLPFECGRQFPVHFKTREHLDQFWERCRHLVVHVRRQPNTHPFKPEKDEAWRPLWGGMPDFRNLDVHDPFMTLRFYLKPGQAVEDEFVALLDQPVWATKPSYSRGYWWPPKPMKRVNGMRYASDDHRLPRYPVYIVSKGRAHTRLTAKALDDMGVPFRIVIEPQEYEDYAAVIDPARILVLPFANLGQGSIPARNWVWEHSVAEGHARHWVLDDNLKYVMRRTANRKVRCDSPNVFRAAEDFVDRFTNVALAGFNYQQFVLDQVQVEAYRLNTRIYSCILVNNAVPHRWRGKYNEDTDLSLQVLKGGWCTVLFNAFLVFKMPTMRMKGGNTDEVYAGGKNRLEYVEALQQQHPDVVQLVQRYGRWHHDVNYKAFRDNVPRLREGVTVPDGPDEYGMRVVRVPVCGKGRWASDLQKNSCDSADGHSDDPGDVEPGLHDAAAAGGAAEPDAGHRRADAHGGADAKRLCCARGAGAAAGGG